MRLKDTRLEALIDTAKTFTHNDIREITLAYSCTGKYFFLLNKSQFLRVNRFWNILCKIKIKKKKKKKSFLFRMDEKWNFVDICWGLKYLAHMFNRLIYLQIYQLQNSCNLLYLYKSLTIKGTLYEVNLKTLQYTLKCQMQLR